MAEKIIIEKRCSWCGVLLGTETWEKISDYHFDGAISHGICPDCMKKEIADAVKAHGQAQGPAPTMYI